LPGEEVFIILMEHVDLPDVKTKRGVVRVKSNLSKIVIEMDPRNPTTPKLFIKSAPAAALRHSADNSAAVGCLKMLTAPFPHGSLTMGLS
jgi:hypothetical protein